MLVMHRGRKSADRMHDALVGIDTDVRFGSEVILVALLGLVHLRNALLVLFIGRTGRSNHGRVDDSARRNAYALAFQIQVHRGEVLPHKSWASSRCRQFRM